MVNLTLDSGRTHPGNTYSGAGAATAIQVVICQPQARFFSGLFLASNPTVKVSAVAATIPGSGSPCVISLSPNANPGVSVSGGQTNVNLPACLIVSDSNSVSGNGAVDISGGATVSTPCLITVGTPVVQSSTLNTQCGSGYTRIAAPGVADPYGCSGGSCVPDPPQPQPATQGSCTGNPLVCTPGYYTNDPNPNGPVTFNPGLYYFEQGFSISGGATASGTGVTFEIATGKTASVSGNATVNFSAPTAANCIPSTCPYVGIVYLGSRTSNGQNNNIGGSSTSSINGAIYFPSDQVTFSGGTSAVYNGCTQIVASTVTISGEANLSNSCNSTLANDTLPDGAPGQPQLVE